MDASHLGLSFKHACGKTVSDGGDGQPGGRSADDGQAHQLMAFGPSLQSAAAVFKRALQPGAGRSRSVGAQPLHRDAGALLSGEGPPRRRPDDHDGALGEQISMTKFCAVTCNHRLALRPC